MRIKKKDIKESIEQLKQTLDNTEKTIGEFIPKTKETLEKLGFKADDAEEAATDIVKGVVNNDEVNEVAVSDSQRKFFNAVHKCKTEGDCGSESIRKAAEGMSLKDIEDYAFTKGKLPKSVDEDSPTGEDFEDIPTGRDLEVDANDYEEFQNLLTQISSDDNTNLDSTENVLPFESIRPKMTKSELIETVKTITEGTKKSRQVLKTIKVKNLRK